MKDKATQKIFQNKIKKLSVFYQKEYEKLVRNVLQKQLDKETFITIFEHSLKESIETHDKFLKEIYSIEEKKRQEIETTYTTIREVASETKRLLMAMSVTIEICTELKKLFFNDFIDLLYYSLVFESNQFLKKGKHPVYFLTYSARCSIKKYITQKDEQITEVKVKEIVDSFYQECEGFSKLSENKISTIQKNEIKEVSKLKEINKKVLQKL